MRLSRQVALATLSKSTKHVAVFVLSIILARKLSTDDYGTYLQVQLVVSTLLYLSIFGVPHSIYFFLPRSSEPRRLLAISVLILNLIALAVAIAAYLFAGVIGNVFDNPELARLSLLVAGFLLFQIPIKLFEPAMIAAKRVGVFVLFNSVFNFLFFFPVAVPALLGFSVAGILKSMLVFFAVQYAAMTGALAWACLSLPPAREGESYSLWRQLVYSFPIGMSGVVGEISRQTDKLLVGGFFNPAQYAVYTRGALEIPLLNVISNSLHNLLMPRFVESWRDGDIGGLMGSWHSAIRLMASFVYPAFVFFLATGDLLIPAIYSDRYQEASIIFQIYVFTLLVRITTGDAIIRAVGRTSVLLYLSVGAIVTNVLLAVTLIKLIGITGAPLATVLTAFAMTAVYVRVVTRMIDVPMAAVFPWRSLGSLLGISAFAMVIASAVRLSALPRGWSLVAMFAVFSVIYLALLKRSRLLNPDERDAVQSLLPSRLRWVV